MKPNTLDSSSLINGSDIATLQALLLQKQLEEVELSLQEKRLTIGARERDEYKRIGIEESEKRAREQNLNDIRNQAVQQKLVQDACQHRKPNNEPSLAGQRDHRGMVHWICLNCQKTWDGKELPMGLGLPAERVGGPHL